MRKFKFYGITAVQINNVTVHTCNVRIDNTLENNHLTNSYGSTLAAKTITTLVGKGYSRREKSMIEFNYSTTDTEAFIRYTQKLGELLKQAALHKLNTKYAWVGPQQGVNLDQV